MAYAVIRIRGSVNVKGDIKDTMRMMRLNQANHCVIIPKKDTYLGMLQKVKDYVTWGEVSPEALSKMITERGRLVGDGKVTDKYIKANSNYGSIADFAKAVSEEEAQYKDLKDIKPVIRLHPPRKGYEGIKRSFRAGGALGYRGEAINELIDRMI